MNSDQVDLINSDARHLEAHGDAIATAFYACLFDLDPESRRLFPADMSEQREKLINELAALVELAGSAGSEDSRTFDHRSSELGETHRAYGATARHYRLVGVALLQALETELPEWNDEHRAAWSRVYALVSSSMMSNRSTI